MLKLSSLFRWIFLFLWLKKISILDGQVFVMFGTIELDVAVPRNAAEEFCLITLLLVIFVKKTIT